MRKFLNEFKEFALRGNVIDLATGVIIGASFQSIINSLVGDIISPLIGVVANTDFSNWVFTIGNVNIKYGSFITNVVNFLIMALVIFIFVKSMNTIVKRMKVKKAEDKIKDTKDCPYCCTHIDINATRCPNCTSMLES